MYITQDQIDVFIGKRVVERMTMYRQCSRCKNMIKKEDGPRCPECKKKKRDFYKSIKDNRIQDIYNSSKWKAVREEVIRDTIGLCEVCSAKGIAKQGNHVHHIIKVSRYSPYNYDISNLINVCSDCHRDIEGLNHEELYDYMTKEGQYDHNR